MGWEADMMLLQTRFVETKTHEADTFKVTCADCPLELQLHTPVLVLAELSVVLTRPSDGVGSFRWVLRPLVCAL